MFISGEGAENVRVLVVGGARSAVQAQTHHASRLSGSRGASSGGLVTGSA
jgi:hypothetical protein